MNEIFLRALIFSKVPSRSNGFFKGLKNENDLYIMIKKKKITKNMEKFNQRDLDEFDALLLNIQHSKFWCIWDAMQSWQKNVLCAWIEGFYCL